MKTKFFTFLITCSLLLQGCLSPEFMKLKEDNKRLQAELEGLYRKLEEAQNGKGDTPELTPIRTFTVGMAATEKDFQEKAFVDLLQQSLRESSTIANFKVGREGDERQLGKIQGLLVQQYLAADEIPILISNLSYKVSQPGHDFKIGDKVVPTNDAQLTRTSSGNSALLQHEGELSAIMRRTAAGEYTIEYEERGVGVGNIPIQIGDLELMETRRSPRSARQGDVSFNWKLHIEKLHIYRVEGFSGDIGLFMRRMRYPTIKTEISQFQTMRDAVFLFGYNTYSSGLVNQLRTPSYIDSVEVRPISKEQFDQLQGGLAKEDVEKIIGGSKSWEACKFIDFTRNEKIWERPLSVSFPFISRQVWEEKGQIFYMKYDQEGWQLIGEFERR